MNVSLTGHCARPLRENGRNGATGPRHRACSRIGHTARMWRMCCGNGGTHASWLVNIVEESRCRPAADTDVRIG